MRTLVKTVNIAAIILLILAFSIFTMLLTARIVAFDKNNHQKEFIKLNVYGSLPGIDVDAVNSQVVDYISGSGKSLDANGIFNNRERKHLSDVRFVVWVLDLFLYASIAVFSLLLVLLSLSYRDFARALKAVGLAFICSGALNIMLLLSCFFAFSASFPFMFESMHKAVFQSGTYIFDGFAEKIVLLYPEAFFYDVSMKILSTALFFSVFLLLNGIFVFVYYRKNTKLFKEGLWK